MLALPGMRSAASLLLAPVSPAARHGDENLGLSSGKRAARRRGQAGQPDELVRALSLSGRDARRAARRAPHGRHRRRSSWSSAAARDGRRWRRPSPSGRRRAAACTSCTTTRAATASRRWRPADELYVKPRYGKFVRAQDRGRRARAAARHGRDGGGERTCSCLQRFVQVHEAGTATVAGHAGVKLTLSARTAPTRRRRRREPGRKWRETVQRALHRRRRGARRQVGRAAVGAARSAATPSSATASRCRRRSATSRRPSATSEPIAPPADFGDAAAAAADARSRRSCSRG